MFKKRLLILLLCGCLLNFGVMPFTVVSATELLSNPDFEGSYSTYATGWADNSVSSPTFSYSRETISEYVHKGSSSQKITVTDIPTGAKVQFLQNVNFTNKHCYKASVWLRSDTTMSVNLTFRRNAANYEDFAYNQVTVSNSWQLFTLYGSFDQDVVGRFQIRPLGIGTLWVDDASLEDINNGLTQVYYISNSGNDTTNTGKSILSPYQTIQKASSVMQPGDTCFIRGGTYRETITPTISGTSSTSKITYAGYNNEVAIVNGTDAITTAWTSQPNSIYKAAVTMSLGDGNQVFIGNTMYDNARWPNNTGTLLQPTLATVSSGTQNTITDSNLSAVPTDILGATLWCVGGSEWVGERASITSKTSSSITFNNFQDVGTDYNPKAGNKYYISNHYNLLDAEKEWYYYGNYLNIRKVGGGIPSSGEVQYKVRQYGIDLSGKKYIDCIGLSLFSTGILTDSSTENCTFDKIKASYVCHGTSNDGAIKLNGSYNEFKNSTIDYGSRALVSIFGTQNRLLNCQVKYANYEATWDKSVSIESGDNHLVSNNTISEAGRACIGFKGTNSQIQYNDLSFAGRLTKDLGIVYQVNADGSNTRIHHNIIHDNVATGLGVGIYLDNFTNNYVIDHNVVWGCSEALRLNTPSNNNLIYNNTLVGTSKSIFHWGFADTRYDDMFGDRIYNNICTSSVTPAGGVAMGYNLLSATPGFVSQNDYHITSNSLAKDNGTILSGITDGFVTKPDIGAYEFGAIDWSVGYDANATPNPTFNSTNAPYMNLAKNAGFESADLTNWSKMSGNTATIVLDDARHNLNALASSNRYGMRLGGTAVADGITQTITGLSPSTTYVVTAFLKSTNAAETIQIGAKNYGGTQLQDTTGSLTWDQRSCEFTTGASNTQADIFIYKNTTGASYVYADCISLITKDPNMNVQNFPTTTFSTPWSVVGTPLVATNVNYSTNGTYSVKTGTNDTGYITQTLDASNFKVVTIRFQDDLNDSSIKCAARVDDGITPLYIGVSTATSTTNYSFGIGTTWTATSVPRITGWREFKWVFGDGDDTKLYIDSVLVNTNYNVKSFNTIQIGDMFQDTLTSPYVYFDEIIIKDIDSIQ